MTVQRTVQSARWITPGAPTVQIEAHRQDSDTVVIQGQLMDLRHGPDDAHYFDRLLSIREARALRDCLIALELGEDDDQ